MRSFVIGGLVCGAVLLSSLTMSEAFARRIRVRNPGGGVYTYYGPGGRPAARAAARRYYAPAPRRLPQQETDTARSLTDLPRFRSQPARESE